MNIFRLINSDDYNLLLIKLIVINHLISNQLYYLNLIIILLIIFLDLFD
jgi:hypothetical protein